MISDPRKAFFLLNAENYLSLPQGSLVTLENDAAMNNFLNAANCLLLTFSVSSATDSTVTLTNKLDELGDKNALIFYKSKPEVIEEQNLHSQVRMTTLPGSPLSSLFYQINHIYAPLLLNDSSQQCDPQIQTLVSDLQAGLGTAMRTKIPDNLQNAKMSLAAILSPCDEFKYWSDNKSSGRAGAEASAFVEALKPLADDFGSLDALTIPDLDGLVDDTLNIFDDLWKLEGFLYPQARMVHLFNITGNSLVAYMQKVLSESDVWQQAYSKVETDFNQGILVCQKWIEGCHRLTNLYWQHYPPHKWDVSKPYVPKNVKEFEERLAQVLELRTVHKQLGQFLSPQEQNELRLAEAFKPFQGFNPLFCNSYTEPHWVSVNKQFEQMLAPIELKVAGKLKSHLIQYNDNALQLLEEFLRYKDVIRRPQVSQEFGVQRETLLELLQAYVRQLKKETISKNMPELYDIPEVVREIFWIRQTEAKVQNIRKAAGLFFANVAKSASFVSEVESLLQELKEQAKEAFDGWSRDTLANIRDKTLSLSTDVPVVSFDASKLMKVNYNTRLVTLIREVRLLTVLGYPVPPQVVETSKLAQKFAQQAKALGQIANFHNTVGDRIIESQKPLLLDAALALSSLVQDQSSVKWSQSSEVAAYITKLQSAVEHLSRDINRLSNYHRQIADKVSLLFDADLIKQQHKWRDGLRDIRFLIGTVEAHGYKNLQAWKVHWDYQIYKALEHQYQRSLEVINENMPDIRLDLDYKQQKIVFRPTLEDVRRDYYAQLKRFVSIPLHFRGVQDSSAKSVFPSIVDRNASRFEQVYTKAEMLFSKLEALKERYRPWVAIGDLDMDEYALTHLESSEDWERNFRLCKAKGQEIAKLPVEDERLGCLVISLLPLRKEIENLNRKYWDTLVSSLQSKVLVAVDELGGFVSKGKQALDLRASSVDELSLVTTKHAELLQTLPEMTKLMAECERKAATLSAWAKDKPEALDKLKTEWDNFLTLLETHEQAIKRQTETIRESLETELYNLANEAERFKLKWEQVKPKEIMLEEDASPQRVKQCLEVLRSKRVEWKSLVEQRDRIQGDFVRFHMEFPETTLFGEIEEQLSQTEKNWLLLEEFTSGLETMGQEEWIIFRSKAFKLDEYLDTWNEKLNQRTQTTPIVVILLKEMEKYKSLVPVLKFVRGETFADKHWMEFYSLVQLPAMPIEKLTLGHLIQSREFIVNQAPALKELNARAAGEAVVRQALLELEQWDVDAKFTFYQHSDVNGVIVPLIREYKEILSKVGENQNLIQSVKDSTYHQAFGDRIVIWETRLADLDEYLRNLSQIQRKWLYLEPVFGRGALAKELARFKRLDSDFKSVMNDVAREVKVVALTRIPNLRAILAGLLDQLARCQKSLTEFLEEKRSVFPRFYFLGDEDLLEILGQATKPSVVQTHLKKLFAGIHSVQFSADDKHIEAVHSIEGEKVPLRQPVMISPEVESWLSKLVDEMQTTLRQQLQQCYDERQRQNSLDPMKYPSQILCLTEAILFSERCEKAIISGSLNKYLSELKNQLANYSGVSLEDNVEDSNVLELKLQALILDAVHYMEIVEELLQTNCNSVNDWAWQKQLRFYLVNGAAVAKMVDAEIPYSYEYQGNAPKLVHTPLTDKCYLTLTQGMQMGLGGNPYGPAGTGKTESVKALGGLLGRQVLVFNCDEGIDVKSMGRIFVGLAKCGAWGCFDEFNRLEEATLSAVSTLIQAIQTTLKQNNTSTVLLGTQIPVHRNTGIFVTLNPAGKGYGGRQKLPDNLKQLFRPVVMSQPDVERIAEVLLYSEGFAEAKAWSRKLVEIFRLAQKLLSRQQHYDWGLRALKSVLKSAGRSMRAYRKSKESSVSVTSEEEADIVIQAVRFNTLSKLTLPDCLLFDGLVRDVFPNSTLREGSYEALVEAAKDVCTSMGLIVHDRQIQKVLELHEQLNQRMGVVIVGPPGSGKSTIWNVLKQALIKLDKSIQVHTLNPKAVSRTQLLGSIDLDTREWTDGILTKCARLAIDQPQSVTTWIVCDGDVDPEWIESLNSVLDDNRLLTVPSGERLQFGPNAHFLFETHDLKSASPATVSRMGVIFLSEEDLNVTCVVQAWLQKQTDDSKRILTPLIEDYFYPILKKVKAQGEFQIAVSNVGLVQTALSHLVNVRSKKEFTVGVLYGFTSNLTDSSKESIGKEIYAILREDMPSSQRAYAVEYDSRRDLLTPIDPESADIELDESGHPIVLAADVQLALKTLQPWIESDDKPPVLLVGPEGSGKGLILKHSCRQLRSTKVATLHCGAHTTPLHVLHKLSQMCLIIASPSGRILRPRDCEKLILHLRDLNLVLPDVWGTAMLVTFLEQVLNCKGCYDSTGEWLAFEGIQIVISMVSSVGTGRYTLSPRLTSLLRIHAMGNSDAQQLELICKAYLNLAWQKDKGWSVTIGQTAAAMVRLYSEVRATFTVDQERHYLFTTRNLTSWAEHLALYEVRPDTNHFIEVWSYEACRTFRDKLVNTEHRRKFDSLLQSILSSEFGHPATPSPDVFYVSMGSLKKLQWTKRTRQEWEEILQKLLVQYGREQQPLDVALIPELLLMTAKADRVLSKSGGCVLMAGRAGVGRHVTIKLLATLYNARLLTLRLGKGYTKKQFTNELKTVMQVAGVDNECVLFVVEDYQMTDPAFLAMINSLLSAGEVPGLYTPEELESITSSLRDQASQDSFEGSVTSYFASRVKANCHVVLMMDFTNPSFITSCEENPAIYQECGILWQEMWDESSLVTVSQSILNSRSEEPGETTEQVIETGLQPETLHQAAKIYLKAEDQLQNPTRFVAFMNTYSEIQRQQRTAIDEKKRHLMSGVSKLTEARDVVNQLKTEALEQEKILAEKQAEAQSALQMITDTMANANVQRGEMQELREQTMRESQKVAERKKAIDAELAEIEPLLAEARSAVADIRPEALSEIRSLRAPPDTIRDILEGVLRLMGTLDTSWSSMKSFLAKRGIKEEIRAFDARKITPENRKAVEALLESRSESFDPRMAKRASTAAAPLAAWVQANVRYSRVIERIAPLEQEQTRLQKNLQRSEEQMGHLSSGLDSVDKQVAMLRDKLAESTREAAQVEIGLKKAAETLNAAQTLVKELEGEYQRWQEQLQDLDSGKQELPKRALLAAAFITFLTEKDELVRQDLLQEWAKFLEMDHFDIRTFLTTEQQLMQWRSEGLPSDNLSIENAMALFHVVNSKQKSILRPYIIDPSLKAVEWLRNHVRKSPVEVVNQQDEKFASTLEFAVRFGKILIVQDAENIEPMLIPILKGDYQTQGTRRMVQLGEKLVDCNPDFQLFLCTRTPFTTLAPSIQALVLTINYNTTQAGLSGQILTVTLSRENPELERRKTELLSQEEKLKTELVRLEDLLLKHLADAQGNILENKELLSFLNSTKASSTAISQSLSESLVLQASLEKQRQVYLPLAQFGSKLFFVVQELATINPVYKFSLPAFFQLYNQALDTKSGDNPEDRIAILHQALVTRVYRMVCRGTFRADRVTCALHLARGMFPALFKEKEWEVFTGQLQASPKEVQLPEWLEETRAPALAALKVHLPSLFNSLQLDNHSLWTTFSSNQREIPNAITRVISAFQQILVIQALAPDRLFSTIGHFVVKALGINELSPTFSVRSLMEESTITDPVLMLLPTEGGAGGDPAQQVVELAQEIGQNYKEVAMGQGQESLADQFLQEAASQGSWLCLKNVHLVTHWLASLERFLDSLQSTTDLKVHPKFRLWLTAEAQPKLPLTLLQRSIKITFEAPPGVKRNIQRSLDSWPQSWLNQISQNPQKLQALVVLAWLHALLQERRFYIPQGWVKAYEFSDADLKAAADVLDRFWTSGSPDDKGPKWMHVQGLLENAVYGGRIDNVFDLRTLQAYLTQYYSPKFYRDNAQLMLTKSFSLPTPGNLQDYLNVIKRLPDEDQAAYFGLPSNIERSVQQNLSETVIIQMKMLGLSSTAQTKFDKQVWNDRLSPILHLWKSLNQGSNLLQMKVSSEQPPQNNRDISPLEAFVQAESYKSLMIMQVVHKSLASLSKLLRGLMPLTPTIYQLGTTLLEQATPLSWLNWWDGPSNPAKYLQGLVHRAQSLHALTSKKRDELLLQPLTLPSFISPEALLSVLRQETARELRIAMDQLGLICSWNKVLNVKASVKAGLSGINIEGAIFAHGTLQECTDETPNETAMPICTVAWVPQENAAVQTHHISLPLYADRTRSKLVTSLDVPVDTVDTGKWCKAGVALLVRE